jgi:hypothetical protein
LQLEKGSRVSEVENTPPEKTTGWEKADTVAHGAGQMVHGIGWMLTKGYAVVLIIVGLICMFTAFGTLFWPALLVIAYGIYLITPGSKLVIW